MQFWPIFLKHKTTARDTTTTTTTIEQSINFRSRNCNNPHQVWRNISCMYQVCSKLHIGCIARGYEIFWELGISSLGWIPIWFPNKYLPVFRSPIHAVLAERMDPWIFWVVVVPASVSSNVDFPLPDGPMIAIIEPGSAYPATLQLVTKMSIDTYDSVRGQQ